MPPALMEASVQYQAAAENLCEVSKALFPIGTLITYRHNDREITAEVIDNKSFWWSRPGILYTRNCKTGKTRWIFPHELSRFVTIIERPEKGGAA